MSATLTQDFLRRFPREAMRRVVEFLDSGKFGHVTLEVKEGRIIAGECHERWRVPSESGMGEGGRRRE